jgi:hypothetical protein
VRRGSTVTRDVRSSHQYIHVRCRPLVCKSCQSAISQYAGRDATQDDAVAGLAVLGTLIELEAKNCHADNFDGMALAASRPADTALRFRGHVLSTGDFLATWAVELAVHQLDIGDMPPAAPALRTAAATVEFLVSEPLPGTDTEILLGGAGWIHFGGRPAVLGSSFRTRVRSWSRGDDEHAAPAALRSRCTSCHLGRSRCDDIGGTQ